jgi:hypothetical protein
MRKIAAGLSMALVAGAVSLAVAPAASADTPQFQCFNRYNSDSQIVSATGKAEAQKEGYFRCYKITPK